ncbi:hypothetical protein PMAYCL1PPCAC_28684, partial [Pristionchus mayeri]
LTDPHVCPQCGARFVRSRDVKRHLRTIDHSINRPVPRVRSNPTKWFKCDKCPKKFTRIDNLKRHRGSHTGKVPLIECPHCDVLLISNLKGHLRQVHKINPHVCDKCGEAFDKFLQLKEHLTSCC